jgi:hypothetical protein
MADNTNFQPVFDYIDQKHQELLENFGDVRGDIRNIDKRLDAISTMVQKLDQERLVTIEWVKRIESEVEKIKKHLQIV